MSSSGSSLHSDVPIRSGSLGVAPRWSGGEGGGESAAVKDMVKRFFILFNFFYA